MEAKDTLMSNTRIWIDPCGGSVDIKSQLLTQAEISFKAGERKVVKWVIEHSPG